MKWPCGKYNGRAISGLKVCAEVHVLWWNWLPRASWNFGEPFLHWLCFTLRGYCIYDFK